MATLHHGTDRADLHLHTTHSDGAYTPAQIVELARRSGLACVAITDHDTVAAFEPARAAAETGLEVVPALELTAEHQGRELHLLAYFIRPTDTALMRGLERLRRRRLDRFAEWVRRLRRRGLSIDDGELSRRLAGSSPGRRHLAAWLVETRQAGSIQQAFQRHLGDTTGLPPLGLPVRDAVGLVRGAGGVAVWAHPAYDCRQQKLRELVALGLQGIEVEYPGYRADRVKQLRELAARFRLVVSGGSDCHGPKPLYQTVGARSISLAELQRIRELSR